MNAQNDFPVPPLGEACIHGSLKRQCRVCELEAEVAERDQRLTVQETTIANLRDVVRERDQRIAALEGLLKQCEYAITHNLVPAGRITDEDIDGLAELCDGLRAALQREPGGKP